MSGDPYERLAQKLDALPNGFPRTEGGVELRLLKKIFEPDEAEMALKMRPMPETVEAIAERLGKSVSEMQQTRDHMVQRGHIASAKMAGQQVYMLRLQRPHKCARGLQDLPQVILCLRLKIYT